MFHLNACVFYSIRKSKRKICSLCYNNGPWLNAILIRDFNNCNNNARIFLLPCLLLLILWLLVEVKIETNPFKVFLGTHFRHRTVSDPADFSCVHLFYIFWSLNTSYLDFWINSIPFVKLREREGQGVDPERSLKGHLWMVDGGYPFPDALHQIWLRHLPTGSLITLD